MMSVALPADDPATNNPGVARCMAAYKSVYDQRIARHESKSNADCAAKEAYCKALPPLDNDENIRDFVACVAYGILADMFYRPDVTRLLYAAQVARNIQPKSAPPPPSRKSEAALVAKLLKLKEMQGI